MTCVSKLYGLTVANEALTSSWINFHSCFSSSHHNSHSLTVSIKLSHLSHRADVLLSKQKLSLSVHMGLKCLRTCRTFMSSSLADVRLDAKALKKKRKGIGGIEVF